MVGVYSYTIQKYLTNRVTDIDFNDALQNAHPSLRVNIGDFNKCLFSLDGDDTDEQCGSSPETSWVIVKDVSDCGSYSASSLISNRE